MLIVAFVKDLKLYLDEKDKLPDYTEQVKQLYEINPNLFKFNADNVFILKMDYLLETVINEKVIRIVRTPYLNENQEQCVGYLIVKKNCNGEFIVDNSHVCDIMDH